MQLSRRGARIAVCLAIGTGLMLAQQDWRTATAVPAVDFSGLSAVQVHALLRLLRNHDCICGCDRKVAQCRFEDPSCAWSKGLAAAMGDALRAGKNENDAIEAAKASRWGKGPEPPKLLEDPVKIPTNGAPVRGPADAPVTLVEFSDFQCPYCSIAVAKLNAVLNAYPTKVKLIFKQFPLDTHSQAALAAAAAVSANRQGKFWEMHDALFAHRNNLSRTAILALATSTGLDMKRFTADLDSADVKKIVAQDMEDGDHAGVEGTPTVYIDGRKYNGPLDLAPMRKIIDEELKKTK